MGDAIQAGVGKTVLRAIRDTRALAGTNTNLGMVLLLAPLAAVSREHSLREGVRDVLANLTPVDAEKVYAAINLAQPGGMGASDEMDLALPPPASLIAAMQSAAERDDVARQYATDFTDVFGQVVPYLTSDAAPNWSLTERIIHAHVRLLAERGDTLIARKCGLETSQRAAQIAKQVIAAGGPDDENYQDALADFDFWLRSDGHRRNPGTTADLIAAGLFVVFRDQLLAPPWK
jgi:triphosphoribosyl-dephospho-CoA synthase